MIRPARTTPTVIIRCECGWTKIGPAEWAGRYAERHHDWPVECGGRITTEPVRG